MDDLREMTASELVDYLREAIVSGGNDVWLTVEEVARRLSAMERENAKLKEALIWCSGSDDFGTGGKARKGWLKLCAPLLETP